MWYIFPQLKGLGYSMFSQYYGLSGCAEAKEYLADPVLRERLLDLCEVLLSLPGNNPTDIFGYPDDLKLQSSMTLFCTVEPECTVFSRVLEKFFDGKMDEQTINIISEE